ALQHLNGAALGRGNSLFSASRQISASLGTALIASLVLQLTTGYFKQLQTTLPPDSNFGSSGTTSLENLKFQAGVSANHDLFIYMAVVSLVVLVIALMLPATSKLSKAEILEEEADVAVGISTGYSGEVR